MWQLEKHFLPNSLSLLLSLSRLPLAYVVCGWPCATCRSDALGTAGAPCHLCHSLPQQLSSSPYTHSHAQIHTCTPKHQLSVCTCVRGGEFQTGNHRHHIVLLVSSLAYLMVYLIQSCLKRSQMTQIFILNACCLLFGVFFIVSYILNCEFIHIYLCLHYTNAKNACLKSLIYKI